MKANTRNQISWHFKDLLKRDIGVAYDCTQWLQPKQRDIDRRARPKRLASRYVAACMVVEGAENPAFARELLDRTEGKVPDRLIADHTKTVNIRIELAHNQRTLSSQVIDGQVFSEQALDQVSSASSQDPVAVDRAPATPVDPPGSHHGGSEE